MAWKQVKTPNLDPYIKEGGVILNDWYGWCLAYVKTAFGAYGSGTYAWQSWGRSIQHLDGNVPSGVYVPIWFSGYGGLGHTAIYKDGKIWSTPISHKPTADVWGSITTVEQKYGVKYVGWSEDIGGVRVIENVIEQGADVADKINLDTNRILAHGVLGRNGKAGRPNALAGGHDNWVNQPLTNKFIQDFFLSEESRQWRDSADANSFNEMERRYQAYPVLDKAVKDLQVALANEQSKPPKEVIKEVEKIVEKTVEVEVIKVVEPSWLVKVREFINKFLKGDK